MIRRSVRPLLLSLLIASPAAAQDPAPAGRTYDDAYLDSVARDLVARARAARAHTQSSLLSYTAIVRERMAARIRLPLKDRTLYRKEAAARVHWSRYGTSAVRVLAHREQHPGGIEAPSNPSGFTVDELFDPSVDRLYLDLVDDPDLWLEHPLGLRAEEHYRFQSGDTIEIRLQDGRTIRAVELTVVPRERSIHRIAGSLYIDDASGALVQAVYHISRTIDMERDTDEISEEDAKYIPGVLRPLELELDLAVIEYSLWNEEHWMPRLLRMEATARAGVVTAPASLEVSYEILHVETEGDDAASAPVLDDEAELRSAADYQLVRRRQNGVELAVLVPRDRTELLDNEHLPPPIWEDAAGFIREEELRALAARLADLPQAPAPPVEWGLHWGHQRPGLLRYNRVEGPSVGARLEAETGYADVAATVRLGLADLHPNARVEAVRLSLRRTMGLALYHELTPVDRGAGSLGLGPSVAALLFGRDDGEYFRATGATLSLGPPPSRRASWSAEVFAERHGAARRETNASLPRLWSSENAFRPNIAADEVDLAGARLALRPWWGTDPRTAQGGLELVVEGAAGDAEYARARAVARAAVPLPGDFRAGIEGGAGASEGSLPIQRHWFLGGTSTLRGYEGAAAVGSHFLRGRIELARTWSWGGLAAFSDAGWAGERDAFDPDDALVSAGLGLTLLDGLVRLDLARALRPPTGWSLEVHVDALL